MHVVRRWNVRRRSPSIRALRDAGPPLRWLIVAGVVGVGMVIVLFLAGVHDGRVLVWVPGMTLLVASSADRDGWRIRMAMAEVATRQRDQWQTARLPIDPLSAEAWLAARPDAPVRERASALVTAGRHADARALLEDAVGETASESVGIGRLRLVLDPAVMGGSDEQGLAQLEALPAFDRLTAGERRYHRLSLAWSMAWQRIERGRPWRESFAEAARHAAPFRVPLRFRAFHALQQLAVPVAYALALLILSALGLTDALLT